MSKEEIKEYLVKMLEGKKEHIEYNIEEGDTYNGIHEELDKLNESIKYLKSND